MRVAVSGASGFIGRRLCEVLQERCLKVVAIGRTPVCGPWDDFFYHDLSDTAELNLPEVDAVFHLAGKAHALAESSQDVGEYFRINTQATERLLEACKKQSVKSFIYFSSVKAIGDSGGVMDESISNMPDTPYGQSKKASEKLVLEGGFVPHPVVIRPSMVYGNTKKGNFPKMIQAVRSGKFPPLPELHNRRSMVHVDDVVQAAILAAKRADAAGHIYIVTDGQVYSTRQIYEWICDALHKPVPAWYVPLFMLKLLSKFGDLIGFVRGRRFVFDSDALEKLTSSACYSSTKIEKQLGFKPKRTLREALPEIVRYLGISK